MKVLLDTNIIIHRETIDPTNEDIGKIPDHSRGTTKIRRDDHADEERLWIAIHVF